MDVIEQGEVPAERESLVGWPCVPEPELDTIDRVARVLIDARNVRATRTFRGAARWRLDRTLYQPEVHAVVLIGPAPASFDDAVSGRAPGFLISLTTLDADSPTGDVPVVLDGVPAGHAEVTRADSEPWEWMASLTVLVPMDLLRLPPEAVAMRISGRRVGRPSVLRLRWHGIDDYMAGRNDLLARETGA